MKAWIVVLGLALAALVHVAFYRDGDKKLLPGIELSENKSSANELGAIRPLAGSTHFSVREQLSSKRQLFFGHREFSDLLLALNVLSNTVDMIATPNSEPIARRFEQSLLDLQFLARLQLGMNEIFLFPANFMLFEKNNPQAALSILDLGLIDPRATPQMPLMAGFVAHVFLRDTQKAAGYYKILSQKPKVPAWVGELSAKLQLGLDPFTTDFRMANNLCSLVKNVFPQSEKILAQTHPECLGEKKQ